MSNEMILGNIVAHGVFILLFFLYSACESSDFQVKTFLKWAIPAISILNISSWLLKDSAFIRILTFATSIFAWVMIMLISLYFIYKKMDGIAVDANEIAIFYALFGDDDMEIPDYYQDGHSGECCVYLEKNRDLIFGRRSRDIKPSSFIEFLKFYKWDYNIGKMKHKQKIHKKKVQENKDLEEILVLAQNRVNALKKQADEEIASANRIVKNVIKVWDKEEN